LHATIEYISAGIIIFMILGVTGQYATNMVYDRVNTIERKEGTEKADKIIDMLLLSSGSPPNWGESLDEPTAIAFAVDNSIKLYQLDFDKVARLNSSAVNYIPPNRVRDLLGLSAYYYLSIRVYPVFNITAAKISDEKFSIKVLNQWNVPVSNINVTAAYVDATVAELVPDSITSFMKDTLQGAVYAHNLTDALGACTLNFVGSGARPTLLVLGRSFSVKSLMTWPTLSTLIIGEIDSSMGTSSSYNVETVYRTVEIDGLNYIVRLTMWS
jgi:hypothetical protein